MVNVLQIAAGYLPDQILLYKILTCA